MIINLIVLKWNHCHSAACRCGGWCLSRVDPQLLLNYIFHRPESQSIKQLRSSSISSIKAKYLTSTMQTHSLKIGKHSIFHHFITIFFPFFVDVLLLALSVEFTTKETSGFFRWWHIHHTKGVSMIDESVMWWFWTCPRELTH